MDRKAAQMNQNVPRDVMLSCDVLGNKEAADLRVLIILLCCSVCLACSAAKKAESRKVLKTKEDIEWSCCAVQWRML